MTQPYSGWGMRFLDYDNDGWKDLLIAQGHDTDNIDKIRSNIHYRQPMLLARNTGKVSSTFLRSLEKCSRKVGWGVVWPPAIWTTTAASMQS